MSRLARTPFGSCTWSVVTQNAGPRYTVREEITLTLLEEDFFLLETVFDFAREDSLITTI
jgi:hypothetical protein